MTKLLLTTKGKANFNKMALIIGGIICIAVFPIVVAIMSEASRGLSDEEEMIRMVVGAAPAVIGIMMILVGCIHGSGYVNVYEDHIEGKGLQGKGMNTFYLSNSQIKSVTRESYYLCIHSDIGTFKIICGKQIAADIMKYFNTNQANKL